MSFLFGEVLVTLLNSFSYAWQISLLVLLIRLRLIFSNVKLSVFGLSYMGKICDVKVRVFNWLAFSLVVYSIVVFGVVLVFSGKVPYSISETMRGLSEYLGILAFIPN